MVAVGAAPPVVRRRRARPRIGTAAAARPSLGLLPVLALVDACGVAIVALADALSRTGTAGGQLLFWVGLGVIFVPGLARMAGPAVTRGERAGVVLLLGLALYLAKVLRDPFAFTYADELVHQHNVLEILARGTLFGPNPILPVTPLYPGLEAVTAAVASLSGLSTFTAGLVVIGAARMIGILALFLLVELITRSARTASLAAVLYAAAPNFLFFTAQFSYESLALPLALVAALAALRAGRVARGDARRWRWTAIAVACTGAVAVTHHMTSYALAAFLAAICLAPPWRVPDALPRPWLPAAVAVAAPVAWLTLVAHSTVGYLSPVLGRAVEAAFRTAGGEAPPRRLFESTSGTSAPEWEHVVAIAATVALLGCLALGTLVLWRRHRASPVLLVVSLGGAAYVGTLALRLIPDAWETGSRSSEFLFLGVAVVLALAVVHVLDLRGAGRLALVPVVAVAALLFAGGVLSGSPAEGRVAQPYRVAATGGTVLASPVAAVADWTRTVLGPAGTLAAQEADARVLLVDGRQDVVAGTDPPINTVLASPRLEAWELALLHRRGVRYVVVDARLASADVSTGYFFQRGPLPPSARFSPASLAKFEAAGADRVYDGGTIRIDDIEEVRGATVPR